MPSRFGNLANLGHKHHEEGHHKEIGAQSPIPNSSVMTHSNSSRRSFFGLNLGKMTSNESHDSFQSDDHHGHHNHHLSHHEGDRRVPQRNASMVQLKRFFRPSKKHELEGLGHSSSGNRIFESTSKDVSPRVSHSELASPTFTHDAKNNMIVKPDPRFWDDLEGSLTKKYGKLGKVLGSGAGGSVRLLVRESDGLTFAVKEFVPRRPNESIKEYARKCTAEFCIGSTLHHPNIIQTIDIISEHNQYFEVMEYAPIDFFGVVMAGKLTRSEINCFLKQITMGVQYLHSVGLAHRDLKLDNCVVTTEGILKLIDFGSAVVFKYPFEDEVVYAHGIVGSDPYLAPEVLTSTESYDPQLVDIWSIAIIYCCMTLRRFPWKAPKPEDTSFRLYCQEDDVPHDYVESARHHKQLLAERKKKLEQRQNDENVKHQAVEHLSEKTSQLNMSKEAIEIKVQKEAEKPETKPEPSKLAESVQPVEQNQVDPPAEVPKETAPEPEDKKEEGSEQPAEKKNDDDFDLSKLPDPSLIAVDPLKLHEVEREHRREHRHEEKQEQPERRHAGASRSHGQIHGPYRLMRLLPHASRPLISRMLMVDPAKRATMKDIFDDEWFSEIRYCTIDEKGNTVNDPTHKHNLEC
ncbi:hypothetical protein OGAPHI_001923 [Ogataea philodendri]|uniref:non-specific serine/threonine protein kinase n=1 Tax=Ogataea philodendri TaxID=1378263 RepID=A0A9P8PB04_9ASCO|nr:uncharacterized protein OGAPHI_001923 [Ogataea philodendri]KAH3668169.1 hypothetical protein OGAPHI_001923 [Ogataea philodendri]